MLIALIAVLGVDLIVIVVLLAGVVSHRRWISSRAGAFLGPIPLGRRTAAGTT